MIEILKKQLRLLFYLCFTSSVLIWDTDKEKPRGLRLRGYGLTRSNPATIGAPCI